MRMAPRPLPELEAYRAKLNLSRKAFGAQLGVSSVTVYRWEKGERKPDRKFAPAISELINVPILTLMGVEG